MLDLPGSRYSRSPGLWCRASRWTSSACLRRDRIGGGTLRDRSGCESCRVAESRRVAFSPRISGIALPAAALARCARAVVLLVAARLGGCDSSRSSWGDHGDLRRRGRDVLGGEIPVILRGNLCHRSLAGAPSSAVAGHAGGRGVGGLRCLASRGRPAARLVAAVYRRGRGEAARRLTKPVGPGCDPAGQRAGRAHKSLRPKGCLLYEP